MTHWEAGTLRCKMKNLSGHFSLSRVVFARTPHCRVLTIIILHAWLQYSVGQSSVAICIVPEFDALFCSCAHLFKLRSKHKPEMRCSPIPKSVGQLRPTGRCDDGRRYHDHSKALILQKD